MMSSDPDSTAAELTFADLQIHPSVLQAVGDVGYEKPSAIQAAIIPAMMAGSDVVGLAQTGTGKTAAFAIPILSKIDPAYTSQTCSACGWVEKKNRRSQAVFECDRCRFVGHADHNAALNIASRGVERWGEIMRLYAAPTLTAS